MVARCSASDHILLFSDLMSLCQRDLYVYPVTRETTLVQRFWCFLGMHVWTSRTEMGLKPDKERVNKESIAYFFEFATPICKHCPTQLPPWSA